MFAKFKALVKKIEPLLFSWDSGLRWPVNTFVKSSISTRGLEFLMQTPDLKHCDAPSPGYLQFLFLFAEKKSCTPLPKHMIKHCLRILLQLKET